MSEINANFVVTQTPLTVTTESSNITVDTDPINLNVFALGFTAAGGQPGNLQYNDGGSLGGAANTQVTAGNVRFTNISNLKIANGSNGYFLQTDGTGNLTWAPGTVTANGNGTPVGANTQIQVTNGSGNFVSAPGFTFDNSTNVFTTPGNAVINGNLTATANVTGNFFIGNGSQLTGIVAANIAVGNADSNSNTIFYPIFVSGLGNVQPQADNFGNVLTYVPYTGTLNTNILDISTIKNSNGIVTIANNLSVQGTIDSLTVNANGNLNVVENIVSNANINANGNIVSNANINANGNIIANGNASATYFIGNGAYLTGIDTSLISNGNSNVRVYANSNVTISSNGVANVVQANSTQVTVNGTLSANLLTGTLTTANQSNITTVGNLTDIRTTASNIHLGSGAGAANQGGYGIGIGFNAGNSNQGNFAIAIGFEAGLANQAANSVAIGTNSSGGLNSVAIGLGTSAPGNNSVAIGNASGADISGVAIGDNAQATFNSIAIGKGSKATTNNTIILNGTGANLVVPGGNANTFTVKPMRNANTANLMFYDPISGEITYDQNPLAINKIQFGTSNIIIPSANSNISVTVNNTTNTVTFTSTGITVANTLVADYVNANSRVTATFIEGGVSVVTPIVETYPRTYANLPSVGLLGVGCRMFITDANTTTFNAIVGGGGSNGVPVFTDGNNWRVG